MGWKHLPVSCVYLCLMETTAKPLHIGRKISRLRELRGMKQDALAFEMGVSQQTVSRMEGSETVDEETLAKVAKALDVSVDTIKNFNEDAIFNYFNNFSDNSINQGPIGSHNTCNFNPLDKVVELYERLLEAEKEKVALLEKRMEDK